MFFVFIVLMFRYLKFSFGEIAELYYIPDINSCASNEFLNLSSFKCAPCDPLKNLSPTTTYDSCTCNELSIFKKWDPNGYPHCEKCKINQIPSLDKTFCLNAYNTSQKTACDEDNDIIVDRSVNGSKKEHIECVKCVNGTKPDLDKKSCVKCEHTLPNCVCPLDTHEILANDECIPKNILPAWSKNSDMYKLEYESRKIESKLLRYKLHSLSYWCKMKRYKSCQYLANMCVLAMYNDQKGPCRMLKELIPTKGDWMLPAIYYGEGEAATIVNKKKIHKKYHLNKDSEDGFLEIFFNQWTLNGTWKGFVNGMKVLSICSQMKHFTKIRFPVDHNVNCKISPNDILTKESTMFYDVYLKYKISNETFLVPLPILNQNYKHRNKYPNKGGDLNLWQLTHRFFTVESVNDFNNEAKVNTATQIIRYLKSLTVRIRVCPNEEEGFIFVPLIVISYGEFTKEDIENNKLGQFSFKVEFSMDNNIKYNVDIGLGVLCSISAIWSFVRAWAYTRRSGQRPIDLVTVFHLCTIACGHLANVFFFVISATALHSFIYFKWQAIPHVLLPPPKLHYLVKTYVIVAFPLKVIELLVLIWHHVTVDIFLIDWEQPRAQKQTIFDVSAWRTYFVANKWNEIQTVRKTSVLIQLSLVVFFLQICGMQHWSANTPELLVFDPNEPIHVSEDRVFRFSLGVIVYIGVYLMQWVIVGGLYERYVKNSIQEFVDICSLANISLFVLSLENYGFYVHGRSAHGFSDTDMATLRKQLRREEEDLVRHRGLVPESDHQTFQILIPSKLRVIYRSLVTNFPQEFNRFNISNSRKQNKGGPTGDHTMHAYVTINRFLAAFIEHALKDLDYEVRDKMFFEALLDIEFLNSKEKGIFFNDNGHSFDNVLYYGNELTLFTFDLILFSFVEILAQNYLLAAILTGLCDEAIVRIRKYLSRKNFAKKALIDEHFLL